MTPREARTVWLEREVEALKEQLERETYKNKSMATSGYWNVPFQTEAARAKETSEAVERMKRNAGIENSGMSSSQHACHKGTQHVHANLMRAFDEAHHLDGASAVPALHGRACNQHVFSAHPPHDRAFLEHEHGDLRPHVRASMLHEHGEQRSHARASMLHEHGEQRSHARASMLYEHGDLRHHDRAGMTHEHGDLCHHDRADVARGSECHHTRANSTALHEFGEACQHGDVAGRSRTAEGTSSHQRGLRCDREVVEDGDLKAIPIQLPQLPSPEGRDASLEAGDWIIQLEPLVGDLSKNATAWWRRVMAATTDKYSDHCP